MPKDFENFYSLALVFLQMLGNNLEKSGELLSSQKKIFHFISFYLFRIHVTFENFCVNERQRTRRERKFYDLENFGVWHTRWQNFINVYDTSHSRL